MLSMQKTLRDRHLIGIMADSDMITGMLLAGIGCTDGAGHGGPNYCIVDAKTSTALIEETFKKMVARKDIAVLIVTQPVADRIRHLVDDYEQVLPALLEVPSKDSSYDVAKDSLLRRIDRLCAND